MFCAPHATLLPRRHSAACARYGNGAQTAHSTPPRPAAPATIASSNLRFAARLPCIFQLPATSRVRFVREVFTNQLHFTAMRQAQQPDGPPWLVRRARVWFGRRSPERGRLNSVPALFHPRHLEQ